MRHLNRLLVFLIITIHQAYAIEDGRWQLTITGQDQLEYGTQMLAGSLNIGWESILEFSIKQGRFEQGASTARLLPNMSAPRVSRELGKRQNAQIKNEDGVFSMNIKEL
jgi:hypothetical protein